MSRWNIPGRINGHRIKIRFFPGSGDVRHYVCRDCGDKHALFSAFEVLEFCRGMTKKQAYIQNLTEDEAVEQHKEKLNKPKKREKEIVQNEKATGSI